MSHENPKLARRTPGMFLDGLNYNPEMSIDLRHRDWLYAILTAATLNRTPEIGSGEFRNHAFNSTSTHAASIQARCL